ncbi:hypothetical protein LCGC14_1693850 [marine sediment metagenome]|uniref:DUF1566 domain-containing protein n=2 Tax=root TaxID=1 RepID=A0A831QTH5_9FLAO|nr:DUF1566 domain-containing protein [Pricia antarctica]
MSSKSDNLKNSGQEHADNTSENIGPSAFDRSQISMNFGQEEEDYPMTEEEFKAMAEAEMKNRAEEGRRLREEMEARKRLEEEQQSLSDTSVKIEEEHRLKKEVEALELRIEEDAKIKEKIEAQEIRLEEEKRLKDEERLREVRRLEEVRAKREIEQKDRKKMAVALKARDEEWRKFKEDTDLREKQETLEHHEIAAQAKEDSNKTVPIKTTNSKRKALILVFMVAIAIVGIWIFSEFNSGATEDTPFYPTNKSTGVDEPAAEIEPGATQKQSISEETNALPENNIGEDSQGGVDTNSSSPSTEEQNSSTSSSDVLVGSSMGDGIIFKTDTSGKSGTMAYARDVEPMTWDNALTINQQLGEGWRLPTMEELREMYATIGPGASNSGQFGDDLYWSNQSYDENQARLVRFSDGDTSFHYNKTAEHRKFNVRAVKDFSQP